MHNIYYRKNEMQQRKAQMEAKMHEVTAQIKQFESDETGYSHRKEYATLEKQVLEILCCQYMI